MGKALCIKIIISEIISNNTKAYSLFPHNKKNNKMLVNLKMIRSMILQNITDNKGTYIHYELLDT